MRKSLYSLYYIVCLGSILLFCVSATASIANGPEIVDKAVSEPLNMLLLGVGLIGLGGYFKSRTSNN
jgi:hypothetical protein